RLAVRQRAKTVASLLVAEVIEQLISEHRVVLVDVAIARIVADDTDGNRHLRLYRLILADDADLFFEVVAHDDRTAERDLFLRESADDRIAEIEERVRDVGIDRAKQCHALI